MTRADFLNFMIDQFRDHITPLCKEGQKEYTHTDDAFSNFESVAKEVGVDKKVALWIQAMKHKDGIGAWLKGHRSQREGIEGRIYDLIVYLFLLLAMIGEDKTGWESSKLPEGFYDFPLGKSPKKPDILAEDIKISISPKIR